MTLCRSSTIASVLLWLGLLAPAGTQAACSDKTLRSMSDAGRSVSTIAKRCGMSATTVKERLDVRDTKSVRAPPSEGAPRRSPPAAAPSASNASPATAPTTASVAKPAPQSQPQSQSQPQPQSQKHPPGTVLELCGCYGSMAYGFTEPNEECLSGKAVATRCPGYCPVNRSPWRRICS